MKNGYFITLKLSRETFFIVVIVVFFTDYLVRPCPSVIIVSSLSPLLLEALFFGSFACEQKFLLDTIGIENQLVALFSIVQFHCITIVRRFVWVGWRGGDGGGCWINRYLPIITCIMYIHAYSVHLPSFTSSIFVLLSTAKPLFIFWNILMEIKIE